MLERSHPPTFYFPPEDVDLSLLQSVSGTSWCEFKGQAAYYDLVVAGQRSPRAAWSYPEPTPAFAALKGYLAFYPGRVESCRVDGELVVAQPGDFYGGWITSLVSGPFKGGPGTTGW
ncbi:MAG: hypothetical protein AMXMBFR33_57160 [Candidatus Xenobia bacterium]